MKSHFEITYLPKSMEVVSKIKKKLEKTEEFESEVKKILSETAITPIKIFITKTEEGKGKKDGMFEDFKFVKYNGKIRGVKKGLLKKVLWKTDFEIYLLFGKKRDGIMIRAEKSSEEIKKIGELFYKRILKSVSKQGIIPWNKIIRIGTI